MTLEARQEQALAEIENALSELTTRLLTVLQPNSAGIMRADASYGGMSNNVTLYNGYATTAGMQIYGQQAWRNLRRRIETS